MGARDKEEFIEFADVDGEVAYLKVGDIALMEIARSIVQPESLDDLEEQENLDEERMKQPHAVLDRKVTVTLPGVQGEQLLTYNLDKNAVTCRRCGTSITDESKTKSEIRKDLRDKGWSIGLPGWAFHIPAIIPEEFYRQYPELKRRTFDTCPSCIKEQRDESAKVFQEIPFLKQKGD